MYRGIPAPCGRSSDTDRGFDRRTRRPSARGQDPPYRRIECLREGACSSTRRSLDRLCPEPLQSPGQILRPAHRYLRGSRYGFYSMVPAGSGQAHRPDFPAFPHRPEPWRNTEPDLARVATAALPRYAANTGNLLDRSSRGEPRCRLDPLNPGRVPNPGGAFLRINFAEIAVRRRVV